MSGDHVHEVFAEKQQIIRKSGLLEYYATNEHLLERGRAERAEGLAGEAHGGVFGGGADVSACRRPRAS